MPAANAALHSFNAGEVSRHALARVDLPRLRLSAQVQSNLLPKVLGQAIFRPGSEYRATTNSNLVPVLIPFTSSSTTKAILELTDFAMRVLIDGQPVTRPTVTAAVTNGGFNTDLSGWTNADDAGATSSWSAPGDMALAGTGANYARRKQQVTVNEIGTEHALRIVIARGPVIFRVGSADGLDDYIAETALRQGTHSLAFTPSGASFWIQVYSADIVVRFVDSIQVEGPGVLVIPTPWPAASMATFHHDLSADVMFCAIGGAIAPQRIERRSQHSWSVALYSPQDGPFLNPTTTEITITPSGTSGFITLTASQPIFKPTHVPSLWRLVHDGQFVENTLAAAGQSTGNIRVTGVSRTTGPTGVAISTTQRVFNILIAGTFVANITLQRAFATPTGWQDVQTYTAPGQFAIGDTYDNQIVYYRLTIKTGDYTSGSADCILAYAGDSQIGIVQVLAYSSPTVVSGEVVQTLGQATATVLWSEGAWSPFRGYPSSVVIHDGRLWWTLLDMLYGSVSDAYESYSPDVTGDSGTIARSIATGPREGVLWLLSMQRLLCGSAIQEISIRASSFDEPLTPTAFTVRTCSRRGSAYVQALPIDTSAVFPQRDGRRLIELAFDFAAGDYAPTDLTRWKPEMCQAGVAGMAVQRQPDTRLWCWLNDGTCAVLTYEPKDSVNAWTPVVTNGLIKSVCVLPAADEDEVYWCVERSIGGTPQRFIERLAKESEVVGGTLSKNVDAHIVYQGSPTTTISGLSYLNGQSVIGWADGAPLPTPMLVSGGVATLPGSYSNVVLGLAYTGQFQSTKLGYGATGDPLEQMKRVSRVGLLLSDVCWPGVKVGRDFSHLRSLPAMYGGKPLSANQVIADYDYDPMTFGGNWATDDRLCIQVNSPYPATLLAAVIEMVTNDAKPSAPSAAASSDGG